jgi:hypothetical protein
MNPHGDEGGERGVFLFPGYDAYSLWLRWLNEIAD